MVASLNSPAEARVAFLAYRFAQVGNFALPVSIGTGSFCVYVRMYSNTVRR